jgi:hypothetical protein
MKNMNSPSYRSINEWFESLNMEVQQEVALFTEKGKPFFLDYIKKNHLAITDSLESVIMDMEKALKSGREADKVDQLLKKNGLQESTLRKSLFNLISPYLEIYLDAEHLRVLSLDEFQALISTLLDDVFVNRAYRSYKSFSEKLTLPEEVAKNIFSVIKSLIKNLYEQNASFDELKQFMKDELNFTLEKIDMFVDLLLHRKQSLEIYFLFDQLSRIRRDLDEISSTAEEIDGSTRF